MKKIILILFGLILAVSSFSQDKRTETLRKFSIGLDLFTDIWINKPENVDGRGFNQGMGFCMMYNRPFGESKVSFAIGAGMGFHNFFSDSRIPNIRADSIVFLPIADSVDYKKSKLGLSYIEVPFELRIKTEKKFRIGIGGKVGYLVDAKTKYKGENVYGGDQIILKDKQVDQVQKFIFGPTLRIGYDWFNIFGYYQVTQIFEVDRGPSNLYPISVGITLIPF
jgi:hypothetical protein